MRRDDVPTRLKRLLPLASALVLACAGSSPQGSSPTPTTSGHPTATAAATATPTPTAAPSPTPTATLPPPVAGAATIHCDTVPSATALLVVGTVAGSSDTVIRDITDLANVKTDCTIVNATSPVRMVSATKIAYAALGRDQGIPGKLFFGDLTTKSSTLAANLPGGFGDGAFAFSADAASYTYIASSPTGMAWHLNRAGSDQVLATYPPVPGRGVNPDNDDFYIGFSPDGRFVALVQTFTSGSDGSTMSLEVRNVSDGAAVFGAPDSTMATWSGTGSTLVYRTTGGAVYKWTGMFPVQVNPSLKWVRPRPSPDGRFVVFTQRDLSGLGHVYTMDLGDSSVHQVSADGRATPVFLTSTLLWYQGERLCAATDNCGPGGATILSGTYVNDVGGGGESPSRLTRVDDIWPHLASGRGT